MGKIDQEKNTQNLNFVIALGTPISETSAFLKYHT